MIPFFNKVSENRTYSLAFLFGLSLFFFAGLGNVSNLTDLFDDPIALRLQWSNVIVMNLTKAVDLLWGDQKGGLHNNPGDPLGTRWFS